MLIDTHCHLDFPEYSSDLEDVINRAQSSGVAYMINVGSSLKGSRAAFDLSQKFSNVFSSVGIHPHDAKDCDDQALKEISGFLKKDKVVAVGEVGLDYFRNLSPKDIQKKVFHSFIEKSIGSSKPLVIHCRQAQEDTLAILDDYKDKGLGKVVIHCFSGDLAFLKDCLNRNFFVSFTCNITYPKASGLREVVKFAPLDKMFLETDAPFLAPQSKRGRRNEPCYVAELAQEVARIKDLDTEEVSLQTTKNAIVFFDLPIEL